MNGRTTAALTAKISPQAALQLLACGLRGATEEVVLGHGVSHQTLAMLALPQRS
jgi:hypothetical protein